MIKYMSVLLLGFSLQVQAQLSQLQAPSESEGAWHIEALKVEDNQAYYQAFMSSQPMLHRTLGWGWPSTKQTAEGNQDTMRYHVQQHAAQRAYSYVIREPEQGGVRGGLLISPVQRRNGLPAFNAGDYQVEVTFWLNQQGQDSAQADKLLSQIKQWLGNDWAIHSALFPVAHSNQFTRQQLEAHGFELVTEGRDNDEILYSFRAR